MATPRGGSRRSWTKRRRRAFLETLRETANVSAAARAAGMARASAYGLRKREPEFREAWDDALEEALDDLEAELRRRALEGVERPVFYGGKECGSVRNYSDSLGMFLLRSRRGTVFAESAARGRDRTGDDEVEDAKTRLRERLERMTADTGAQERSGDD